jgi:putative PIG3 family NAD(P)H quinone oxidoreductase
MLVSSRQTVAYESSQENVHPFEIRTLMPLPDAMNAVAHDGAAPLRLHTLPTPRPGPGEILIKVAAAGVNRPDLLQRSGLYPPPPGAPQTLGLEAAGEIVAVGEAVSRWRVGDTVAALLPGGGYADYALAPQGSALPVPPGLSLIEAAALPETVFTVWANVFEACALKAGERFLVHGGASGIGSAAIQMAVAHGAQVFATAGDAAKVALCERLGAKRAINYKSEDFEDVLKGLGGVDVILDMVAGPYIQKNLNLLKDQGRLCFIAFLQGPRAEVDFMRLMLKRLTVTGSTLRARPTAEKARIAAAVERQVWPWIAEGRLRPVIDCVLPFREAEAAHARMQAGAHAGKIMLTP